MRCARVLARRDDKIEGLLQITQGKAVTRYFYSAAGFDFGIEFNLARVGRKNMTEKTYHVCLSGKASSCECDDFKYRGRRTGICKHIACLRALREAGKL